MSASVPLSQNECRFCGGTLVSRFRHTVMRKLDVEYFECQQCQSLQTEFPYWLEEAYSHNLANLDTGAAQRNLQNLAACLIICDLFKVKTVIDFGGGDGLLCRLLRDYRIDCYVNDKYSKPTYAQGFTNPIFGNPDMLLAFEVFEHLANPSCEINEIFKKRPKVLMATTELYTGQKADWWYLAPESGQHVFFYSPKTVQMIAQKYGYHVGRAGNYLLFVRGNESDAVKNITIAQTLLDGWIFQAIKSQIFSLPTPGIQHDFNLIKEGK